MAKIKKTIAILLVVMFVVTVTAGAVSAIKEKKYDVSVVKTT